MFSSNKTNKSTSKVSSTSALSHHTSPPSRWCALTFWDTWVSLYSWIKVIKDMASSIDLPSQAPSKEMYLWFYSALRLFRLAHWVYPKVVCEVRFRRSTIVSTLNWHSEERLLHRSSFRQHQIQCPSSLLLNILQSLWDSSHQVCLYLPEQGQWRSWEMDRIAVQKIRNQSQDRLNYWSDWHQQSSMAEVQSGQLNRRVDSKNQHHREQSRQNITRVKIINDWSNRVINRLSSF